MRLGFALALLLLLSACLSSATKLVKGMTRGEGWYRVESRLTLDADGALIAPPHDADDDTPYMRRIKEAFDDQFTQVWIDGETPCLGVIGAEQPPDGPVYLLVHGVSGIGNEWMSVIPTLAKTKPAAIFMYRWLYYDERGHLLGPLVKGIERFAQCYPKNRIIAVGHSAGGVLLAFAASRLTLSSERDTVELVTVASPLAGVGVHPEIALEDDDTHFFNDLGGVRGEYPAAAPSVAVTHLRTTYPADKVMEPNRFGYAPNAPNAVVKGSRTVEVPNTLGHDESLLWAAKEIAAGRVP
jgi:pimeloyl-ACP methyl ester carboxylesterase